MAESRRATEAEVADIVANTTTFCIDCDGVVWKGDHLIEDVATTLERLRDMGKNLVFLTNNSTKSRTAFKDKFHRLGLTWVDEGNIINSSYAATEYLRQEAKLPKGSRVYVVGEQGIVDELALAGYHGVGAHAHEDLRVDPTRDMEIDRDIQAVVVGYDKTFNYYKLQYATACLHEIEGCHFVATNMDATTHLTPTSQLFAGGGTMVAAVSWAVGRQPTVAGKPSTFLRDIIARTYNTSPASMCMIGDRLDTDIQFGNVCGMRSILVMSGVTAEKDLHRIKDEPELKPSIIVDSLASLQLAAQ